MSPEIKGSPSSLSATSVFTVGPGLQFSVLEDDDALVQDWISFVSIILISSAQGAPKDAT